MIYDYDGTIADSFPENFIILERTAKETGLGSGFPYRMEETRLHIRPYVTTPSDYYIIAKARLDGVNYRDPQILRGLRKDKEYAEFGRKGEEAYRAARKEWDSRDRRGRLANIRLFPGARHFIDEMQRIPGAESSIITTAKEWNVRLTLAHLLGPAGEMDVRIFDKDYGSENYCKHVIPRDYQFFKLREDGFIIPETLTLDDNPENLQAAERWDVKPFAVSHGYGNPDDLSKYRIVTFEEMLDIVSDLTKK